jgi:RPA family protein
MSEIKRQTAYKCSIKDLNNAKYIQQQGLNPNYVDMSGIRASRVNIFGILTSKEGNTLTMEDGSGQLQIMIFDENQKKNLPEPGKLILLIGKPREHNNTRFVVPEIIRELDNHKWVEYRKKELDMMTKKTDSIEVPESIIEKIEPETIDNHHENIIQKIKELDKGDGAPYQELIKSLKIRDAEKKIEELIKEGEIFEIKGKLKLL